MLRLSLLLLLVGSTGLLSGVETIAQVRIQEVQGKDPGGGAKGYDLLDGRSFWVTPTARQITDPDVVFVKKLTVGGDPCVELTLSPDGQRFVVDAGKRGVSIGLFLQGTLVSVPWVPGGMYTPGADVVISLNKGEGKKVE